MREILRCDTMTHEFAELLLSNAIRLSVFYRIFSKNLKVISCHELIVFVLMQSYLGQNCCSNRRARAL